LLFMNNATEIPLYIFVDYHTLSLGETAGGGATSLGYFK
jgi:hypothetical protein